MFYRNDCRYFIGEKPCRFKRECAGCPQFESFGTRILIIKLGAIGDVLRTTPLLRVLKERYPHSHVTWVVEENAAPLLRHNSLIDRVLTPGFDTLVGLSAQKFDVLICLDKVERATGLAMQVQARQKLGFGLTEQGNLTVFNEEAQYALYLGVSDQEKFQRNQKPYQQIMIESLGFPFNGEEYVLPLDPAAIEWAAGWREQYDLAGRPIIGVNTGAGNVFAGKAWKAPQLIDLCRRLHEELDARVLLLGGPRESERNRAIANATWGQTIDTGCDNSLQQFAALIDLCDGVVTGDTTAMHIAIARHKKVVALFGSTCAQEIDLYGRGEKILAEIECAPCYLRRCPIGEACMNQIETQAVFNAMKRLLSTESALKTGTPEEGIPEIGTPLC